MAQATLSWKASISTNVIGYKIYIKDQQGDRALILCIDAGNVLSQIITGLAYKTNYYFVVTAYTSTGAESALSNEVNVFIPGPIPSPPSGVVVSSML